jgi:hypothetical protein
MISLQPSPMFSRPLIAGPRKSLMVFTQRRDS